ncbi:tyrosine protein phosphatase [Enterococcus plantarum]|uniref:tyrosine-protein phosphatase n=1 Tax=Enterococcus plantarum TaxID=1077675 RepID=UPI00084E06D0|nr:tyrosine-protein phosphatase [Enterococcus plantarum]OEG11173.1 tyrosine protein phosphatase [Enterococcus plantarum]
MITNLRDIGGITVPTGTLKEGYFYRSGQLVGLEKKDIQFLEDDCRIKKVYDFRNKTEISEQPDMDMNNIKIENIDILASEDSSSIASLQGMLDIDQSDVEKAMFETYEELVISNSALSGYSKFLTEILEENQPILFHCFAGKDRTGFAAALILKIAGASDQSIMDDYLKTNESRKSANKQIIDSLKSKLTEQQLNALELALNVDKTYLCHAKKVLEEHFGSFDNYLLEGLKLDTDYVDQFRKKFIV